MLALIGFESRMLFLGHFISGFATFEKNIFEARFEKLLATVSVAIACKHVSFELQGLDLDWSTIERFWANVGEVEAKTYTEVRLKRD